MKLKKLFALGLAVVMTTSSLAACGSSKEETADKESSVQSSRQEESSAASSTEDTAASEESDSKEIVFPLEETMEFTMVNGYVDALLSDVEVFDLFCERGNISFELTEFQVAECVEKSNLLITSGDYPDVFWKGNLDCNGLGSDGVLIPLEDLIREYAPTLTALLDERDGWSSITAPDGHVYSLPNMGLVTSYLTGNLWFNKEWMEAADMTEPTNMDELTDLLRAYKELDVNGNGDPDDEIPYSFNNSADWRMLMQYVEDGMLHWPFELKAVTDDGKMVYYPTQEEFKEHLLSYLVTWYEEGLMDPNAFTLTVEQMRSIGLTNNVYGLIVDAGLGNVVPAEYMYQYHILTPFEGSTHVVSNGITQGGMCITDKCENPEVLVAWVDYLYTEEGGRLADLGIEGKHYQVNEDDTITFLVDAALRRNFTVIGGGVVPILTPTIRTRIKGDPAQDHINAERYGIPIEYGVYAPDIVNTEEELQRINDLSTNLNAYVMNYVAQVVVGELSLEDSWQEFQDTLADMGAAELTELYQTGYDRGQDK